MRRLISIAALLISPALLLAQAAAWDLRGIHAVQQPISEMNAADRHAILQQLKIQADQLHGKSVTYNKVVSFVVQGVTPELCEDANCKLWIFDAGHRQVLYAAGNSKFLPQAHHGRNDVLTLTVQSETEEIATRWQYDGFAYQRISCASVVMPADATPNAQPQVTTQPCRASE